MSKLDKLKSHIERWGVRRTAYALVMRAASKLLGIEVFVLRVRETPEQEPDSLCELPGVTFRPVADDEMLSAAEDTGLPLNEEFVRPAIDRGDFAFGAFHEDRLTAYVWRSTGLAPHYDDCWVRVPRPYSYSYNSYARPEFRGQRLVPSLIRYSDHEMQEKGYSHRVGMVATTNFASLRMGKHMGSHDIGHVGFLKWFNRYYFFHSAPAANIGFRFIQPSREKGDG